MSTYTGSAFATKYAAYLIYKGSATAAALNISQPKIGYVYDITEGGTLTPGNITVQQGDAVVYLAQGWTHCNNGGADQAIANLSSQFDELLEEIGETDFSKFALKTQLPTVPDNVSAFNNDAGYLTEHQSLANYALKTEIPNVSDLAPYSAIPQNVSQLTNDAHYLTEAVVNDRVRKVDDLAQDTDAADGEIVQLTTDGRFYRFTEPQAEGESGTWTTINQPADIASNDQILSQNNSGKLTATLGMSYNATNQHLELKGNNGAVVAYVDMAVFIKDGMLENVEKYTTPEQGVTVVVPYLKFTFNTDSGKSVIRISFADLIDTFDGSNVDLTSAFVKAAQYSAPTIGDSMDTAIGKLLKGHEDNAAAIATKQDTLTFDSTPTANSTNPVTSGGIKAAIDSAIGGVPNALKQVDLTTYQGTTNGEIVQHRGTTTANYTDGYVYQYTAGEVVATIPAGQQVLVYPNPNGGYIYRATSITKDFKVRQDMREIMVSGLKYYITYPASYQTEDGCKQLIGTYTADANGDAHKIVNVIYHQYQYAENVWDVDAVQLDNGVEIINTAATGGEGYPSVWLDEHGVEYYSLGLMSNNVVSNEFYSDYSYPHVIKASQPIGSLWNGGVQRITPSADIVIRTGGWQRINVQPSSEGAVSDLETRMTAAETAISGKQATITGAASTITDSNLTASKVLGSDANGKVAATSIATADAEDAVSKRHTQNTDTKIQSGNNKVEVSASGTAITGNGSVSGNFSVSGNLNVTGKETVEEIVNIKSVNNFITLRDGAQTAIASGDISGTKVENYDGLNNDLLFGTDASGVFRIGDEGGTLEPIMTRAEAANLADGELLMWDATNQRAVRAQMTANKVITTDANGRLNASGNIETNELETLNGATGNIQTQLNAKASSANLVNGAPLSNASSYFYGVSTSAANATQKEVSIPSITALNAGQVIVVLPTTNSNVIANATLKLNDFAAYPIKAGNDYGANWWNTWVGGVPSTFVFYNDAWVLVAKGYDTSYSLLSVAEGIAGTATASRVVRADYLQQIIHAQIDKFVGTRAMSEDAYWDLVTAGTVQSDTLYITYDNDWEG